MLIKPSDVLDVDPDLDLLEEILWLVDRHVHQMELHGDESEDPDQFGYFDRAEHLIGLGFAACQTYLTATYGPLKLKKNAALALGPLHSNGRTIVALVNASANYWKHHDEWQEFSQEKGDNDRKAERTIECICSLDISLDGYVCSNLLSRLVRPLKPEFRNLIPLLVEWRDNLDAMVKRK